MTKGQRTISFANAIKIARCLGLNDTYWIRIQSNYEMRVAYRKHEKEIEAITPSYCMNGWCFSCLPPSGEMGGKTEQIILFLT